MAEMIPRGSNREKRLKGSQRNPQREQTPSMEKRKENGSTGTRYNRLLSFVRIRRTWLYVIVLICLVKYAGSFSSGEWAIGGPVIQLKMTSGK